MKNAVNYYWIIMISTIIYGQIERIHFTDWKVLLGMIPFTIIIITTAKMTKELNEARKNEEKRNKQRKEKNKRTNNRNTKRRRD